METNGTKMSLISMNTSKLVKRSREKEIAKKEVVQVKKDDNKKETPGGGGGAGKELTYAQKLGYSFTIPATNARKYINYID